jgi:dGTPase
MLVTKQQLEQWEKEHLAPYASLSANSKGRRYPESPPNNRTDFQRDRDRVLHSTAFRRLEYKTQVFINYEGDHYRTRLTHTLEVAQIGRSIATALGANPDLTEAICLVHDIGHPPFGHSGEFILDELMKDHGGFEHNRQSYRVVTELEKKYPSFPGLNLTYETLEGIAKHQTDYDHPEGIDDAPDERGHIEAQIADIADSLAYTAHDLDDGLRSKMLHPGMLKNLRLWQIAAQDMEFSGETITDIQRHELIRNLIGYQINELLKHTETVLVENHLDSQEKLKAFQFNVVDYGGPHKKHNRELKKFLYENMYYQYRVIRMSVKAEQVISSLFTRYCEKPRILPTHIQHRISQVGLHRTVCDYIAGMTDRFAIEEHQKLFNPTIMP